MAAQSIVQKYMDSFTVLSIPGANKSASQGTASSFKTKVQRPLPVRRESRFHSDQGEREMKGLLTRGPDNPRAPLITAGTARLITSTSDVAG